MNFLGTIVRLQIQRGSLKRMEDGRKVYDPAPLLPARELTLTRNGAAARAADGSFVIDVHNLAHPYTKNSGPNTLSFVFTSHYGKMRERFGERLTLGCAGENILVETRELVPIEQVAGGVAIRASCGEIRLEKVIVATPCKSFSGFALGSGAPAPAELKETLQFLDHGMRGFYCELAGASPVTVALGDQVFAI